MLRFATFPVINKLVFADTLNRAAVPTVDSEAYEEF